MGAEELLTLACEHLALGELETAIAAAEELARVDPESAAEVRALALCAAGRAAEALAGLEALLRERPAAARLHVLLAGLCAELGMRDRALDALARARAAGAEEALVGYHEARLLSAAAETERALAVLTRLPPPRERELGVRIDAERARLLTVVGRPAQALELLEQRLDEGEVRGMDRVLLVELLTERARAIHASGHGTEEAARAVLLALALDPTFRPAADLLRAIDDRRSADARRYHLVLECREPLLGTEPPRPGMDGHHRTFEVIAATAAEARSLALRHEQATCPRVVDCQERDARPGELIGVVEAGPACRFTGS
jgi:tetratricopeptide (TPR) repeat protein